MWGSLWGPRLLKSVPCKVSSLSWSMGKNPVPCAHLIRIPPSILIHLALLAPHPLPVPNIKFLSLLSTHSNLPLRKERARVTHTHPVQQMSACFSHSPALVRQPEPPVPRSYGPCILPSPQDLETLRQSDILEPRGESPWTVSELRVTVQSGRRSP